MNRFTRKAHEALTEALQVPHEMPSRPFGRVRALWLCRRDGCSDWNHPDRPACRSCGADRAE